MIFLARGFICLDCSARNTEFAHVQGNDVSAVYIRVERFCYPDVRFEVGVGIVRIYGIAQAIGIVPLCPAFGKRPCK